MRVLVTGATGFIGRHLVARLAAAGDDVVALVRAAGTPPRGPVRVVTGSLTERDAVRAATAACDAVVHLANASGVTDERVAHAVNVDGTALLLEAARDAGVGRVVFTSSISARRARMGPYGRTKRAAEDLVRASGVPSVILRPSLVYGDLDAGLVATLVRHLRSLPVVPVVGDGTIALDPVHVDDVCDIVAECLRRDDVLGRTFDVLGPERVTFDDLLRRLGAALGVRPRLVHVPAGAASVAARVLGLVLAKPPLTLDHVTGLTSPAILDGEPASRVFRIRATPLADGLRAMIADGAGR
jgi:nucleoside-diphosphate-sugar epimerase